MMNSPRATMLQPKPAQRMFWNVFAQNFLNNYGYFAPLSVLGVYLLDRSLSAAQVGTLLLLLSASGRASRALFAPLLDRIPTRCALTTTYLVMGAGYIIVAESAAFVGTALGLFMVGTAYGSCSLLLRVITVRLREDQSLRLMLVKLAVGTNIAATLGPLLSSLLYVQMAPNAPFLVTGLVMVSGGLVCHAFLGNELPVLDRGGNWWKSLLHSATRSDLRLVFVATAFTWFALAQIFSFAPIVLGRLLAGPEIVWTIAGLNAALVVGASMPLMKTLERAHVDDVGSLILSAVLVLACFALLSGFVNLFTLYLAVALLTVVEIVALPSLSVLLVQNTPGRDHLALLGINAIGMGLGEALGNFVGVVLGSAELHNTFAFAGIAALYGLGAMWLYRFRSKMLDIGGRKATQDGIDVERS
ncbi:MFS transporter [Bradyrhizobium niftali]|uniref:MFS transporter n=1 Tax=Bradyrhizobium niftali TaxID=2560055 RepID=A0A4Y9LCR0_9BRAD|nr:MFS transporter [Bradyrhizobium niftali]TFV41380.1 MFS transporter [Bradyrhizobium niftali]